MKKLHNQEGIALVTALMFTMICLAMIMTLMYYVLSGTKMSAAQKKYRNSLEASYGGTDLVTKTIIPRLFSNWTTGVTSLGSDFGTANINLQMRGAGGTSSSAILQAKINSSTNAWAADALRRDVNPKVLPDFIFTLRGQNAGSDFRVYSKIVDTIAGVGLLDASGIDYIDAAMGVAGSSTTNQTPRTPNIFSVEVQGEAAINPKEKAGLSVLYAY
jgi:hypothetical protein